ncbi:hypothetical protein D7030_13505 [Flavobacteriaceae bacterium AU392]|nr:hypothetical protein D1817_04985 [Flavobacteriaceae bacterium]RKM81318.1 hypothetical protein D7030_13505 [Flavobacteriaceae bacterium AU392]
MIIGVFFLARRRGRTKWSRTYTPPSFNKSESNSNVTTSDAIAGSSFDTQTGSFIASSAVDGLGKATGEGAIGHKVTFGGSQAGRIEVTLTYEYRTKVEITDGPASAYANINAVMAPLSHSIADDSLNVIGLIENPATGLTLSSHTFRAAAVPNQEFEVVLDVTTGASSTAPNDAASCSAVAEGKLKIISAREL